MKSKNIKFKMGRNIIISQVLPLDRNPVRGQKSLVNLISSSYFGIIIYNLPLFLFM